MLVAALAPAGSADAATRTFPGCRPTLAKCINSVAPGSTIVLRTNKLIPIPNDFEVKKGLTLVAAKGFHPKIGRTGAATTLVFLPPAKGGVTIRGITFQQVSVAVSFAAGTKHKVVFERNVVRANTGSNGTFGFGGFATGQSRAAFTVRGNNVSASGKAIEITTHRSSIVVTGNRVTAPVPADSMGGIAVRSHQSGTVKALVANNVVHEVSGCNCGHVTALHLDAGDASTLDARVLNNTVSDLVNDPNNQAYGIRAGDPDDGASLKIRLYNNTVSNTNATGFHFPSGPTVTVTGARNNAFGNDQDQIPAGSPLEPLTHLDPDFLPDYKLSAGSPLANAGQTCIPGLAIPRSDVRAKFRFFGMGVDIGATERGSTAPGSAKGISRNGTNGANTMLGTKGRDILCGFGGKDLLAGFGGADYLNGGAGPDQAFGGTGADRIDLRDGTKGNDSAYGEAGSDVCLADAKDKRTSC